MFTSPLLFEKLGWKGVASATPNFMMYAGIPFFMGCILYNLFSGEPTCHIYHCIYFARRRVRNEQK